MPTRNGRVASLGRHPALRNHLPTVSARRAGTSPSRGQWAQDAACARLALTTRFRRGGSVGCGLAGVWAGWLAVRAGCGALQVARCGGRNQRDRSGDSLSARGSRAFPSPSEGVVHLGPFPLRAYAFMIILGSSLAVVVTGRRLASAWVRPEARGRRRRAGRYSAGIWAPVSTTSSRSPERYFGENGHLVTSSRSGTAAWRSGERSPGERSVPGSCAAAGVPMALFADAAAPGLALAQAVGRWGN